MSQSKRAETSPAYREWVEAMGGFITRDGKDVGGFILDYGLNTDLYASPTWKIGHVIAPYRVRVLEGGPRNFKSFEATLQFATDSIKEGKKSLEGY